MNWRDDKAWSDQFLPEIRRIVGPHLLVPSSLEIDRQQAADLVILKAKEVTIACRVRRPGFTNYGCQFTIRSARDTGTQTELEKIVNGWADWMFYGHAHEKCAGSFSLWHLVDLSAWRAHLIRKAKVSAGQNSNGDGTHFVWFDIASFPPNPQVLIASSHPEVHGQKDEFAWD